MNDEIREAPWGVELAHGRCPYCGEPVQLLVDSSAGLQHYVEDCQVCCRPNLLTIRFERDGWVSIEVEREYDA